LNKFLGIFIFCFSLHAFADQQIISVHGESVLGNQKTVLLGDIAELTGFEPDVLSLLKNIEIIDTPETGAARHFTNIGFAQILRQKLTHIDDSDQIDLKIPNEVVISKKNLKITRLEIETELLLELKKQCENCDFELSNLVMPIINQDLPSGATWKIKVGAQIPRGSFSLPLEVKYDDSTRRLYWLGGTLNVRRLVPVAKHNITVGENIKADDFRLEKHEITFINDSIAIEDDLKVAVAVRSIMANQVIEASAIRKPSAIRYGDIVRVVIGEEGWQVSMEGVAQQNAYKGDMLKVKIGRSQKIISGIAMDKGLVEVR
jgi:flagella basal body P-ring formation protein FlgA